MKKLLLSIAAVALCSTVFAAEPKVLYDRNADTWVEKDLSQWENDNADYVTQSIDNGLKMVGTNSGWSSTKIIVFEEKTIVNLEATLIGGGASGRSGSYDFLKLGEVEVRLYGSDNKATIVIGETESEALTGFTRNGNYNILMTVNQASKDVKVTVSEGAEGEATGTISTALTETNEVIVGHHKAGRENYEIIEVLQAIKIAEETQSVDIADYTINYKYDGNIIKTETSSSVVGGVVNATSPLTVDEQKYYFADGATTSMTLTSGTNVLDVNMRKAYVYNYTVNNNVNADTETGTCVEGESAKVPYSRYILATDGGVWLKDATNKEYKYVFSPNKNDFTATLEYTETETKDGVFFKEAEECQGFISTDKNQAGSRASNSKCGYTESDNEVVTITTLSTGTYNIKIAIVGNAGATFTVKAGNAVVLTAETKGYWLEAQTEKEIVIDVETPITIESVGATADKAVDYFLITGSGKSTDVKAVEVVKGDNKWYNLQGVQVAQPTKAGIYIHNGKKIIVK